jgi:phage shock protein E
MEANNKQTIIDVRTPEEFNEEHIKGAINIPVDQVGNRIDEIKEMPQPIVAYCRSGNRSGMAVTILKQNGITDVTNGGGLDDMKQSFQ